MKQKFYFLFIKITTKAESNNLKKSTIFIVLKMFAFFIICLGEKCFSIKKDFFVLIPSSISNSMAPIQFYSENYKDSNEKMFQDFLLIILYCIEKFHLKHI